MKRLAIERADKIGAVATPEDPTRVGLVAVEGKLEKVGAFAGGRFIQVA